MGQGFDVTGSPDSKGGGTDIASYSIHGYDIGNAST